MVLARRIGQDLQSLDRECAQFPQLASQHSLHYHFWATTERQRDNRHRNNMEAESVLLGRRTRAMDKASIKSASGNANHDDDGSIQQCIFPVYCVLQDLHKWYRPLFQFGLLLGLWQCDHGNGFQYPSCWGWYSTLKNWRAPILYERRPHICHLFAKYFGRWRGHKICRLATWKLSDHNYLQSSEAAVLARYCKDTNFARQL